MNISDKVVIRIEQTNQRKHRTPIATLEYVPCEKERINSTKRAFMSNSIEN